MKKRIKEMAAILLAAAVTFTGCGASIPDMTAEQAGAIGEYAAGLLLRHDKNYKNRLVDLADYPEETQEDVVEPEEIPSGMPPVADTPVVELDEQRPSVQGESIETVLALPEGITLAYQGEQISESYPVEDQTDLSLVVEAVSGKKLLVLQFRMNNESQTNRDIDLLSEGTIFRVTVNGNYTRNALMTMLEDDLSVFTGTLNAGESMDVVLIVEIEEAMEAEIASVGLTMINGEKTSTIQLK